MNFRIQFSIFKVFVFLFFSNLNAQSAHDFRVKGDRHFSKKEMDKAEDAYRRSLEKSPENAGGLYNLGNALYQQGRYPQAAEFFERSVAKSKTSGEKADAFFNAGNSHFRAGEYQKAVDSFKNSLKNRPNDPETAKNLELAKRKIKQKEQEEKQKEEQEKKENQPQNQDKKDNQKQNQDQKQDQNQPQNGDPNQQQPQKNQENQTEKQQPNRLTKEQAERLLETAIEQEDRKNGKKYRQQKQRPTKVEKDW